MHVASIVALAYALIPLAIARPMNAIIGPIERATSEIDADLYNWPATKREEASIDADLYNWPAAKREEASIDADLYNWPAAKREEACEIYPGPC